MLFPPNYLLEKFLISPKAILHVGAHLAEESMEYSRVWPGVYRVWVEAQERNCLKLREILPADLNHIVQGAAWNIDGQLLRLKITNNSESSSLLKLKLHSDIYPNIKFVREEDVFTITLSKVLIDFPKVDLINLDIQGAELEALKGAGDNLRNIKWIYSEVNRRELYEGSPLVQDIDKYLINFGFKRIETRWIPGAYWGDAIYLNTSIIALRAIEFVRAKVRQAAWQTLSTLKYFLRKLFQGFKK